MWDVDGVLVDTESLHYKAWQQMFRELGIVLGMDEYKQCIGRASDVNMNYFEYLKEYQLFPKIFNLCSRHCDRCTAKSLYDRTEFFQSKDSDSARRTKRHWSDHEAV